MAFVLKNAPKKSTKLLASAEWTLAIHKAPQTHAVLEELGVAYTGDYFKKQWPARIAAIRAKHPLSPEAERIQQESSGERRDQTRPGRRPGPSGGTHNARGIFGFIDQALGALLGESAAEQPTRRASADFKQNSAKPDSSRFTKLAGADAGLKPSGTYRSSGACSKEFYAVLKNQPAELDALWVDLHTVSYSLEAKPAPPAKWLVSARGIVARHGDDKFQAMLLRLLKEYEPTGNGHFLGLNTLRALIYLASDQPADTVGHALAEYALKRCYVTNPGVGIRNEKLGNACVWSLGQMPGGAGVPYLARILARTKYPKIRKKIEKQLNIAAERAGISRADLDETTVPTHDLDRDAMRVIDSKTAKPFWWPMAVRGVSSGLMPAANR